jgi:hypothetical protein
MDTDNYNILDIMAGVTSAEFVSHTLVTKCPSFVSKCGFDTLPGAARTMAAFGAVLSVGMGVAFLTSKLHNRSCSSPRADDAINSASQSRSL